MNINTFNEFIDSYVESHDSLDAESAYAEAKLVGFTELEARDILDFIHEIFTGGMGTKG